MAQAKPSNRNIDAVQEFITFTATQGGADAFVQATVETGLLGTGDSEMVYQVDGVICNVDTAVLLAAVTAATKLDITVTRTSKTATPVLTDTDLIAKYSLNVAAHASNVNGAVLLNDGVIYVPLVGAQLIAGANFYVQVDSTNLAAAVTVTGRAIVVAQKRTKSQILEILYG